VIRRLRSRRCPVCGADHYTCGGTTETTIGGVLDTRTAAERNRSVSELKSYKVLLNGVPTEVQLTEEDYKRQGWKPAKDGGEYAEKGKTEQKLVTSKSRTPDNKARGEEATK
jgi:hypothetical protein